MPCYGLDAAWLKSNFMFGVETTDDNGNEYPDEMFDMAIESAIDEIESEVGIVVTTRTVTHELHDLVAGDWQRDYQFQTAAYPVQSISQIVFQHGDFAAIEIPSNWIVIRDSDIGLVDIIRGQGSFVFRGGPLWSESGLSPNFLGWNVNSRLPAHLRVTYTAGFVPGQKIPAMVKMAIGYLAARLPLDTAGTLIGGVGISNYSKSMDGVSESVGTTNSPENHGLSSLFKSREPQITALLNRLRARYRTMPSAI